MKEEGNKKMRVIDADKLFEEIKCNDLEFMQQANLMICLKNIIDRQPTIPKPVDITDNNIEIMSYQEASMSKKLSETIKELEDKKAIKQYYFYREYYSGKTKLHLELNQNIADKVLKKNK